MRVCERPFSNTVSEKQPIAKSRSAGGSSEGFQGVAHSLRAQHADSLAPGGRKWQVARAARKGAAVLDVVLEGGERLSANLSYAANTRVSSSLNSATAHMGSGTPAPYTSAA